MNKFKTISISILLSLIIIILLIHIFKFERREEVYSNINPRNSKLNKIKTIHVGQTIKFEKNIKTTGFNRIALVLLRPGRKKITCNFNLKSSKNGAILTQKKITLRTKVPQNHILEINFPKQDIIESEAFYFEISSSKPFFVFTKAIGDNRPHSKMDTYIANQPIKDSLVFGVTLKEKSSIFSFITSRISGYSFLIGIFLIFALLLSLIMGIYFLLKAFGLNISKSANRSELIKEKVEIKKTEDNFSPFKGSNQYHLKAFFSLVVFILIFISISILIGNNTYSKLLASEDDAYITFKYAKNIANGVGFRFNSDEKILGTTTPLYTILISIFGLFTSNLVVVGFIINLISILLSSIIIYRVLSQYFSPGIVLIGSIGFLFFPMFYRIIGMETNFLILLLLASLYFYSIKKYPLASIFIGLATLTRIEATLLIPLLTIHLIIKKEYRIIIKSFFIYLLTILPWFIFSYLYFGNLLPNTFYIKTTVGYTGDNIFSKLLFLTNNLLRLQFMESSFFKGFYYYLPKMLEHYFIWIIIFIIALLISIKYHIKTSFSWLYLFWCLLYILSFSILNVPQFIWYYVLSLSFIPIIISVGFHSMIEFCSKNHKLNKLSIYLPIIFIFALFLFEAKGVFNLFYGQWYSKNVPHLERFETYMEVSDYINNNIQSDKTIATEEIGILGYSIKNKIWDLYCLIHEAKKYPHYIPAENKQRIPYLLTIFNPDYILLNSFRLKSNIILQNYQEIKTFRVNSFLENPEFYYSLLMRKHTQLLISGDVQIGNQLSGDIQILGQAFSNQTLDKIEVLINQQVVANTTEFYKSPVHFRKLYRFNPYAKKAGFGIKLDTTKFENGKYEITFRAIKGTKSAIFFKKTITLQN